MSRLRSWLGPFLLAVAIVASPPTWPAGLALLRGTVTISDGTPIPPGALLRVSLHDLSPGVAKTATVATKTFEPEAKTPIRFELPYNESVIEDNRLYGVAAALTNSRGQTMFETRVPIRVLTLGNQKTVELIVRPVELPKAAPEPTSVAVQCEGLTFDVELGDHAATLVIDGSKIVLPRTEASVGKRYSDGATTLAVSGSAAYVQRPDGAFRDCIVRPREGR